MLKEQLEELCDYWSMFSVISSLEAIDSLKGIIKEIDEAREVIAKEGENRKLVLRSEFKTVTGKDAFMGWGEAELERRIEDAREVARKAVEEVESFSNGDEVNEYLVVLKRQGKLPKMEKAEVKDLATKKNKWKKAMSKK